MEIRGAAEAHWKLMCPADARELVESAEYLLWVLARCDVESLSGQRSTVLRRLRDLESRAAALHIPDLYRQVIESPSFGPYLQT